MADVCLSAASDGIDAIALVTCFCAMCALPRETAALHGIEPLFPLWEIPTPELARSMISGGLRRKAGLRRFPPARPSFGWPHTVTALLYDLPATADPRRRNGEFHSCVYDGPMSRVPLRSTPEKSSTVMAHLRHFKLAEAPMALPHAVAIA